VHQQDGRLKDLGQPVDRRHDLLAEELVAGIALGVVTSRYHEALPVLASLPEN